MIYQNLVEQFAAAGRLELLTETVDFAALPWAVHPSFTGVELKQPLTSAHPVLQLKLVWGQADGPLETADKMILAEVSGLGQLSNAQAAFRVLFQLLLGLAEGRISLWLGLVALRRL